MNDEDNLSFSEKIKIEKEKTPENQKITKIISDIIAIKTKIMLNSLFSIIKSRIKKLQRELFSQLKLFQKKKSQFNIPDYRTSKLNLKKILIISKIKSGCNNLFEIYKLYRLKKMQKYFQHWKNISLIYLLSENLQKNISEKINKSYESKINNLNKEFRNKQKTLEELKETEENLQSSNKQIEKEKDALIKNKKKLLQKIEQTEKENTLLEKEKKNKNNMNKNTYQNFYSNKKDEEKIKELEKRLKELEEEEIDRKNYMNEYSEEMGKIMGVFEQKAKEIMRLQDMGQFRRRIDSNIKNTGISTHPNSEFSTNDNFSKTLGNK